jgi:hypothetical protein
MTWVDIAVIVIPILIAVIVYALVNGSKKNPIPTKPNPLSPASPTVPTISIAANNILLDSDWSLSSATRVMLEQLARRSILYIFVAVTSMDEMRARRDSVQREFDGVVPADQILFCQTAMGRASMARQLEVLFHIDYDPEAIHQVAIFHKAVFIGGHAAAAPAAICACETFEEFIGGPLVVKFPMLA